MCLFKVVLKGGQRPAAFAIVCFCFCEFHAVSYPESCAEQVAEFAQSILDFVLPLRLSYHQIAKSYAKHKVTGCARNHTSDHGDLMFQWYCRILYVFFFF